ncbi:hypothetical protein Nepgr_002926 [Nepenthes gracilis]|uniref:AB hydrolase-1 domain-containing protein n=1 Tax=Nepenthes gracilis TaxID=150966 RepID=A0AAD3PAF2_NEPGR|nr:hypothetical protein Nepgr_002926 [Nepenthes gracilis]
MNFVKPHLHLRPAIPFNPMQSKSRTRQRRPPSSTVTLQVVDHKPLACTADELHYVSLPHSDWSLALWRYLPPSNTAPRNHPLLLLSGVGTNAIGYDLSPQNSFARYMSRKRFDTWILEVRGAGLSRRGLQHVRNELSENGTPWQHIRGRFEARGNSGVAVKDSNARLQKNIEGHRPAVPPFSEVYNSLSAFIEDFEMQLDLLVSNDWDFDEYLMRDMPVVMEYIRAESKPKDGKLLAIGHSMGGILLYAMLSLYGFKAQDPGLATVITLASSLDYTSSRSSLKLLLPLAEPAQALNVSSIPIGALVATIHHLASYPPYVFSWLNSQISAQDMMIPEYFEKLVLKNFCTVPAKLLLQLATAFQKGGLRDRDGTFYYKDHLHKSNVPIMALAGDQDLICPPEAVYETVKVIPEHLITYKVFGEPCGPHYAHYDIVGGQLAAKQVYPCIVEFLAARDSLDSTLV